MLKRDYAELIESHHLYTGSYNSKDYYKYSSENEIKELLKKSKARLKEMYEHSYNFDGSEKTRSEMF